jgi:hypothetical protein
LSSFWLTLKQQWTIFSNFSLAAILVGSRDHRTQFWKGAIQGPFHQSLVAIGPVVSEEKIKMWNVDGRQTKSDDNSSHGLKARLAKKDWTCSFHENAMKKSVVTRMSLRSDKDVETYLLKSRSDDNEKMSCYKTVH